MLHRRSLARGPLTVITLALALVANAFAASKVRVLHTFQGGTDGATPWANLVLDKKGNLYGTTEYGGTQGCYFQQYGIGCGTVYSLRRSGKGWKEIVLYRFQGGSADGSAPRASLVFGPDGNFYSTTSTGGPNDVGTVFQLVPGTWTEKVLFNFSSEQNGWYPQCAVTFDRRGNIYGTTVNGSSDGSGVVFELMPSRSGVWNETVLHSDIGLSLAGVLRDKSGNLYDTADSGGAFQEGSVYELSFSRTGWNEKVLYSFQNPFGGSVLSYAGLISDRKGNLYGATGAGGLSCPPYYGCGTVYEMTRIAGKWQETTIYEFKDMKDGWGPDFGNLAIDRSGNLYGATEGGGQYGFGTVFKLSPVQGGWQKTTLYSFPGGAGGAYPYGGLVVDEQGNVFGTTHAGGGGQGAHCKKDGCGVVFEITP